MYQSDPSSNIPQASPQELLRSQKPCPETKTFIKSTALGQNSTYIACHTLYNVCSVHWGMFSTLGGVQYIGGYHEYIGGCSVHRGIS